MSQRLSYVARIKDVTAPADCFDPVTPTSRSSSNRANYDGLGISTVTMPFNAY